MLTRLILGASVVAMALCLGPLQWDTYWTADALLWRALPLMLVVSLALGLLVLALIFGTGAAFVSATNTRAAFAILPNLCVRHDFDGWSIRREPAPAKGRLLNGPYVVAMVILVLATSAATLALLDDARMTEWPVYAGCVIVLSVFGVARFTSSGTYAVQGWHTLV